jgi:hypothetical protein
MLNGVKMGVSNILGYAWRVCCVQLNISHACGVVLYLAFGYCCADRSELSKITT